MRVIHFSDQHFAPKTLGKVQPCVDHILGVARSMQERPDAIVLTGDLTDHALDAHSPALAGAAKAVKDCSDIAPTIVLQGTFSHEPWGLVDLYRLLSGKYPIYTATTIHQVALMDDNTWLRSDGYVFHEVPAGAKLLFTLFPTTNKADVAAVVGATGTAAAAGDAMLDLMNAYAPINQAARAAGVPTMVLGHGTVSGCLTEHDVPMAGLDHEFNLGGLYTLQASAVALGHIHKHQVWSHGKTTIAYAGSTARLHHGEVGDKGGILWDVGAEGSSLQQIVTPTRESVTVAFQGVPTAEELRKMADQLNGRDVRVRWEIEEADRHKVDRLALEAVLREVGAHEVKLEGTVNVQARSRAAGMNLLTSLSEKLALWATQTGQPSTALLGRLTMLEAHEGAAVAASVIATCDAQAKRAAAVADGSLDPAATADLDESTQEEFAI